MVSIFKKKLDILMGKNRNGTLGAPVEREKYSDPFVCKFNLVSVCPHELFTNTKFDLGDCKKRHDEYFKVKFGEDEALGRYLSEKRFIEETIRVFHERIEIVDNKVKKIQDKQDIGLYHGEIPPEFQERVDVLDADLKRLLKDMELLGERGQIEECERLAEQVESLRATKNEILMIAVNPVLASKQLKICEVCGAMQAINEVDKRNLTHLEGKLHVGFSTIRVELEKLRKRLEVVELQIAVKREEARQRGRGSSSHQPAAGAREERRRPERGERPRAPRESAAARGHSGGSASSDEPWKAVEEGEGFIGRGPRDAGALPRVEEPERAERWKDARSREARRDSFGRDDRRENERGRRERRRRSSHQHFPRAGPGERFHSKSHIREETVSDDSPAPSLQKRHR